MAVVVPNEQLAEQSLTFLIAVSGQDHEPALRVQYSHDGLLRVRERL